jgi:hypothetical protein
MDEGHKTHSQGTEASHSGEHYCVTSFASEGYVPIPHALQAGLAREGHSPPQHKLHITELAAFPQTPIVFMQRALGVARELWKEIPVSILSPILPIGVSAGPEGRQDSL